MLRFGDGEQMDKENINDNICKKTRNIHGNELDDESIAKKRMKLPK